MGIKIAVPEIRTRGLVAFSVYDLHLGSDERLSELDRRPTSVEDLGEWPIHVIKQIISVPAHIIAGNDNCDVGNNLVGNDAFRHWVDGTLPCGQSLLWHHRAYSCIDSLCPPKRRRPLSWLHGIITHKSTMWMSPKRKKIGKVRFKFAACIILLCNHKRNGSLKAKCISRTGVRLRKLPMVRRT
jgi:hypothetical protein